VSSRNCSNVINYCLGVDVIVSTINAAA
jgi:hypothetical protein